MNSGRVTWVAPSNIALVKYWGKYGNQLPQNPSVSFTLKNAVTTSTLIWNQKNKKSDAISLDFKFEGKREERFEKKIVEYLQKISFNFPFVKEYSLSIESKNSFPHSTGIASSASSMSSLALMLVSLLESHENRKFSEDEFKERASILARLASGSACRSIYGGTVSWGQSASVTSTEEYAKRVDGIDSKFQDYSDAIIIVDSKEKRVSSRNGHSRMGDHPFASTRYQVARENFESIIVAMRAGDIERFNLIVEQEALMLHAMMMTSTDPYILMKPDSIEVINRIKDFKSETHLPITYTLDAGPNIHLLYPLNIKNRVETFLVDLKNDLQSLSIINDKVGEGPFQL